MARIIIDPACNYLYSSYYIKGICDLFPNGISFSSQPFLDLKYGHHTHIFAFVFIENILTKRIIIDFADSSEIQEEFLTWSDVYGKINLDTSMKFINKANKIVSLAPGFGIKLQNKAMSAICALFNFQKCYNRTVDFRSYLSNYLSSSNRMTLFNEPDFNTSDSYVFFMSTYWESQDITNNYRLNFIKACRSNSKLNFEGGLVSEAAITDRKFEGTLTNLRIEYKDYISKISKSLFVFNTPAYHLCHGWKLAEYLALGKAIISTQISNFLPAPLEHGKNIYYVSGEMNEIEDAIKLLSINHQLRKKLERGAYEYYIKYVRPQQAIKMLLG